MLNDKVTTLGVSPNNKMPFPGNKSEKSAPECKYCIKSDNFFFLEVSALVYGPMTARVRPRIMLVLLTGGHCLVKKKIEE